ncbi:uncharacterized protein L3040_006384 [Drepanopeziza brunnea f. sp. 'multigermtubi']|uniref:uncharacterized protein n=1 Tax=Drepanopeziza brunnea f. sp. 'multigermtubi' TaxID=698441 RepID=UPI002382E8B1|nr:hypothetical protein L3040_006384 [Drepanopeziza brunnea f. sp. 'multigermtubi']
MSMRTTGSRLLEYRNVRPRWVMRRLKLLRTSKDEKILANRSKDGPFDSLAMSRATQKQGGTISIGLVLSRESGRRAHQLRSRCIEMPLGKTATFRIPLFKPIPAAPISLRLYETMKLLSTSKTVFELEVEAPYVAGCLVGFTTKQDPGIQRLQHKFMHAFAIGAATDGEGNPIAYTLDPKLTIAKFPLGAKAFVRCLEHAKEEYQIGIHPLTVTALCFRYSPAMRGNIKWDPHHISRQWFDFPLLGADKVEARHREYMAFKGRLAAHKEEIKERLKAQEEAQTVFKVIGPEKAPEALQERPKVPVGLSRDIAKYFRMTQEEARVAAGLPIERHWYVKERRRKDQAGVNEPQASACSPIDTSSGPGV